MWYAILAEDMDNSLELRLQVRAAHLEHVKALADQGRVLLAGPHPAIDSDEPGAAGFSGSLLVVEFPSLKDAQDWASQDPYVTSGVFQKVVVKPFKRVLP
jgi:uncharacterized protein YciI